MEKDYEDIIMNILFNRNLEDLCLTDDGVRFLREEINKDHDIKCLAKITFVNSSFDHGMNGIFTKEDYFRELEKSLGFPLANVHKTIINSRLLSTPTLRARTTIKEEITALFNELEIGFNEEELKGDINSILRKERRLEYKEVFYRFSTTLEGWKKLKSFAKIPIIDPPRTQEDIEIENALKINKSISRTEVKMNKDLITFLKNKEVEFNSNMSSEQLFARLVGARESDICFKEWSSDDEKKFKKILQSSEVFKSYFELQLELSFSTPVK